MSAHRRRRTTPVSGRAAMIAALAILLLVGAGIYAAIHALRARGSSDRTLEFGAVQEAIKGKLESAAYFPPMEEASFENTEDGKIRVTGEVDAVSSSGRSSRYSYTVVLSMDPDGNWIAGDVSLVPI